MMLEFLRKKYHQLAYRIYMTGKNEFYDQTLNHFKKKAIIDKTTVLHRGCEIRNLSKDPNRIKIGAYSQILGLLITYPYAGEIIVGTHCSLSEYSRIVSGKKITIGNRVLIAHNVNILDNISHSTSAKLRHEDFLANYSVGMKEFDLKAKEIIIEDDVWIGFNCIILKGVKIGRGAIIGAGSVVTKDIDPWTINVGNPIQCIKKLEPQN